LILLLSAVFYANYATILTGRIYKSESANLNVIKLNYENFIRSTVWIGYQIAKDKSVEDFFKSEKPLSLSDITSLRMVLHRNLSYEYIDSIYLINKEGFNFVYKVGSAPALVLLPEDVMDTQISRIMENYKDYRYNQPIAITLNGQNVVSQGEEFLSVVWAMSGSQETDIKQAVVVNTSIHRIANFFISGFSANIGFGIIERGKVIASTNDNLFPLHSNPPQYMDIAQIKGTGNIEGYYLANTGEQSMVVWRRNILKDRIYTAVIPYSSIISQIYNLTEGIIIACAIILLAGVVAAIFISYRINKPIRWLNQNSGNFAGLGHVDGSSLRYELLRRILRDEPRDFISENEVDFCFDVTRTRALFLIDLTENAIINEDSGQEQKALMISKTLAVITHEFDGYVHEACAMSWQRYVVIFGDSEKMKNHLNQIIRFRSKNQLSGNSDKGKLESLQIEDAYKIFPAIQAKIKNLTQASVTAVFVRDDKKDEEIPNLYRRASERMRYSLYYGHGAFIGDVEMEAIHRLDYESFGHKLTALREAAEKFKAEECRRIFVSIIDLLYMVHWEEYSASILNVGLVLSSVINKYSSNKTNSIPRVNGDDFITNVSHAGSLNKVKEYFYSFFDSFGKIEVKDNAKNCQRAMQVKTYIDENFQDHNLYTQSLADHFGVSAAYLGHVFSEYNRVSLNRYLSEVRINKSKELLKNSNFLIGEIADVVGFSEVKYFYKVFKNITGTTPNTWRQETAATEIKQQGEVS
jgi:AraC-like DNA-binding protein